jgi:cytochrome c biogenesis protein CcmG, thiol:disulfide interchange protein DsbE
VLAPYNLPYFRLALIQIQNHNRVKLILSLLFCVALATGFTTDDTKKLPNITISDLQGKPVNIIEAVGTGKVTILSFWATWCSPCKRELDAITELYPDWEAKYGAQLFAISIDNARMLSQVKPLIEEKGWEFKVLMDSKQDLQHALEFQAIPQTFVLDKEGNIIFQHEGYTPGDEFELEKVLKEAAGK